MIRIFSFLIVILLSSANLYAQSYIGHSVDNYSGIHGVILNPSAVVDSRMKKDFNLFSVSAFAGSDYLSLDYLKFIEYQNEFNIDDSMKRFPKGDNQFFMNADVLGPSFMLNLSPVHSLGFTSRLRSFVNLSNISGTLLENLIEDFNDQQDYDYIMKDFSGMSHVWGEIGLTYGRILFSKKEHFVKGGVSLKYLHSGGTLFAISPETTVDYSEFKKTLTTTGTLDYSSTVDFDSEDFNLEDTWGVGGDLGFTYEYRKDISEEEILENANKYKIKLGFSITDIGYISYDNLEVTNYNLNNSVKTSQFEDKNLDEALEDNYEGSTETVLGDINLPTAMHILVDYNIRKSFYFSLNGSFSMIGQERLLTNRIINTVTATPRFETKLFSFYLPVSIRQHDVFSAGAGLRFGPLTVGSGSAITNLLSTSDRTTDVYLGIKVPIYQ